jgi:hypothetical protein
MTIPPSPLLSTAALKTNNTDVLLGAATADMGITLMYTFLPVMPLAATHCNWNCRNIKLSILLFMIFLHPGIICW